MFTNAEKSTPGLFDLNDRPTNFATASTPPTFGINDTELKAALAVGDVRTASIILEAGGLLDSTRGWAQPIIAAPSMFVTPSIDGGAGTFSPNALVKDRYYDLVVTANGSKTVTATPSSMTVDALDRALPKGFMLSFSTHPVWLAAAAAAGATSISVTRRLGVDVSIADNDTGIPLNSSFMNGGISSPRVRDLMLVGNPSTVMYSGGDETGSKYTCDGLAGAFQGISLDHCRAWGFRGHGFFFSSTWRGDTVFSDNTPLDFPFCQIGNLYSYFNLSGVTIVAGDLQMTGNNYATGNRDYGFHFIGTAPMVSGSLHAAGNGIGIRSIDNAQLMGGCYGDFCNIGCDLVGDGAVMQSYYGLNNYFAGLRMWSPGQYVGTADIHHDGVQTNTSDSLYNGELNGYALLTSTGANDIQIQKLRITCTNLALGALIGTWDNGATPNTGITLRGAIYGDGGDTGIRYHRAMSAADHDLRVEGFSKASGKADIYFDVEPTASNFVYRGASTSKIRWADASTGTLAAPNIPASFCTTAGNRLEIRVF